MNTSLHVRYVPIGRYVRSRFAKVLLFCIGWLALLYSMYGLCFILLTAIGFTRLLIGWSTGRAVPIHAGLVDWVFSGAFYAFVALVSARICSFALTCIRKARSVERLRPMLARNAHLMPPDITLLRGTHSDSPHATQLLRQFVESPDTGVDSD